MELKIGKQNDKISFEDVPIGSLFETQGGIFYKTVRENDIENAVFMGCVNRKDEEDFCIRVGEITSFDYSFKVDGVITNAKIVW